MYEADILSVIFTGKILLFLPFLVVACRQDLRTRTVFDSVWILAAAALLPAIIIETAVLGVHNLFNNIAAGILMFLLTFVCFYFKVFGGADCKAFLLIAFFFPPDFLPFIYPTSGFLFSVSFVYSFLFSLISSVPVSVFMNSLVAASVLSLFWALLDFKTGNKTGNKTNSKPGGKTDDKPDGLSFVKWLRLEVPFMLPLLIGFTTAILFGNSVFKILFFVFSFLQGN